MLVRVLSLLSIFCLTHSAYLISVHAQPAQMRPSPALPSYANDASLHSVFFLDPDLGWACGDRGTILVTVDGGAKWDVVATGYEGTLKQIHFFSAEHGIALGGRSTSLPQRSQALILETINGGQNWKRVDSSLPAIHAAGFFDGENAWAVADCSAQYPSGLFRSNDGGASWSPAPGVTPGPWLCGAFANAQDGIFAGYESIVARTAAKGFAPLETGFNKPVAIRAAAALQHGQSILAGDRGAVLRIRRGNAPEPMAVESPSSSLLVDFHAIAARGEKIWLAGSPGTAVYHSTDSGETWTKLPTGQSTPIRSLYFMDDERGFAVGDLGLVLATRDGGQTWRTQRRAGQHAAYLGVFTEARQVPWELIARCSGQEGHYGYLLCVASRFPSFGAIATSESDMIHRAAARLGAIGGAVLPDYPLGEPGGFESLKVLESRWKTDGASARERLEADLVRQIQMWRPEVLFTELPPSSDGEPASQLTSQAVLSAVASAAQAASRSDTYLSPWQVKRVYAVQPGRRGFKTVESGQLATRLGRSLLEAAWPARRECVAGTSLAPELFGLQLLLDHTDNDATRSDLFSGIRIEAGGPRRRTLTEPTGASVEQTASRANRHHTAIKLLREANDLLKPHEIKLERIVDAIAGLDPEFSAAALYEMGRIAAARGNRTQAISAWQKLTRELPGHPLAGEAAHQLFASSNSAELLWKDNKSPAPAFLEPNAAQAPPETLSQPDSQLAPKSPVIPASANLPDSASQEILSLLTIASDADEATRFMAAALQRRASDPTLAFDFYRAFAKDHADSPFAKCAEMELWLLSRRGKAPKPTHDWREVEERPYLDGKLDEPMWRDGALALRNEQGDVTGSQCWVIRDKKFLYFAARCPTSKPPKPAISAAIRDQDDSRNDRVELLLDIDRDWSTFFRLAVCEDGSTLDDCGGDKSWNPKWYVAIDRQTDAWTAECAIPLSALAPYPPQQGDAWAMGLQRRAPERSPESWSYPASSKGLATGFGMLCR